MKTFVLGDCHGAHKALVQCLERCGFDYDKDKLICLGDVVDGWPETPQVIEELKKIKHLVLIEGNHDTWAKDWFLFGSRPIIWTMQGGQATIDSYIRSNTMLMVEHRDFFRKAVKCYVDKKKRLFVHGGFKLGTNAEDNELRYLTWDRDLYDRRHNDLDITPYKEVFIGHTSTWNISHLPFTRNNVWFLDQGAGWEGCLTIMNVNTHKYWQSDKSEALYPGLHGR